MRNVKMASLRARIDIEWSARGVLPTTGIQPLVASGIASAVVGDLRSAW